MTPNDFRALALRFPEAVELHHMNHPDFRVRNKIFATLGYPGPDSAMVALDPVQQREFILEAPQAFSPVPGGWGVRGATLVHLDAADPTLVERALATAFRNKAPKRGSV